jgi:hypothetical protein
VWAELEQIQSTHRAAKIARYAVFLRKTALGSINSLYNNFEFAIGRLLLLTTFVSLTTMPLTQHIWTWDGFLHGGQDFESGVLVILTTLCLVLLLAQHGKQSINFLLAASYLFSFVCPLRTAAIAQSKMVPAFCAERIPHPVPDAYALPLQV